MGRALTVMLLRKVAGVSRIESFTDSAAAIESLSALEERSDSRALSARQPKLYVVGASVDTQNRPLMDS